MSREAFFQQSEDLQSGLIDWEDGIATRVNAAAHGRHGYFISHLHVQAEAFLRRQNLGHAWSEVFLDVEPKPYGADIAALFTPHLGRYKNGRINGLPDLIVEVISPESESRDRTTKFDAYAQLGVPWYWIGDPSAGTLEEYRLTPEGYLRTASGSLQAPFRPQALNGLVVDLSVLMDPL